MEGKKDFDEEPIDALVSRLIKRGDTYKGKFKKLKNSFGCHWKDNNNHYRS